MRNITPHLFFPAYWTLQPEGLHHPRGVAESGLPPLCKILNCCLPQESGPYLSTNVAAQPLRPATDRRLGGPLPRQLANETRTHPMSGGPKFPPFSRNLRRVLGLSRYYHPFRDVTPEHRADYPRVTHPCATEASSKPLASVRLARLRHAASNRSEP